MNSCPASCLAPQLSRPIQVLAGLLPQTPFPASTPPSLDMPLTLRSQLLVAAPRPLNTTLTNRTPFARSYSQAPWELFPATMLPLALTATTLVPVRVPSDRLTCPPTVV